MHVCIGASCWKDSSSRLPQPVTHCLAFPPLPLPLPPALPTRQGHEIELLDQLTGGRVVPSAAGEEGAGGGFTQAGDDAYRPPTTASTFSFLRTLRSEEATLEAAAEGQEGAAAIDPAAAEATRRAFEGAVLSQWQRLRAMRAA